MALEAAIDAMEAAEVRRDPIRPEALVRRVLPEPARLQRDRVTFAVREVTVNALDLLAHPHPSDRLAVELHVPFVGDPRFFQLTAAAGLKSLPSGEVDDRTVVLTVLASSADDAGLLAAAADVLDRVNALLAHQAEEVTAWRDRLGRVAGDLIAGRRLRLDAGDRIAAALRAAGYTPSSPVQTSGLVPIGRSGRKPRARRASQIS